MAPHDDQRRSSETPPTAEQDEVRRGDDDGEQTERRGGLHLVRSILKGLGGLLATIVAVVLLFLLILQTNWGTRKVADAILNLADPFDDASLTIGDIEGNWVSRLRLHDVNIIRTADGDTVRMVHADTLRLHYRLLSLLRGTFHVRDASATNLWVEMQQRADSSWDLIDAIRPDTTTDTTAAFTFRLDQLRVDNGNLTARYYPPAADSTLIVRQLNTQVHDLILGDGMALQLPSLAAEVKPPGSDIPLDVAAAGSLAEGLLSVDTLRVDSPRSDVRASGRLLLPGGERDAIQNIDFRITADPIAFGDIHPFVPALNPGTSLTLDAHVTGTSQMLTVNADGSLAAGGSFSVQGDVSPSTQGDIVLDLEGQVRRFDPGVLTGNPEQSGLINADLTTDLRGPALDDLSGTAHAEAFDTRYGEYDLDRTTLDVAFDDGVARVDLSTGLRGSSVTAGGTVRPFGDPPTYDLQGRLRSFDIGRFTQGGDQHSDITGTFRLEGHGFDPESAEVKASIDLAPSTFNRYEVQSGNLTVDVQQGRLDFDTELQFPEGFVAARGDATFGGDVLRYTVDQGRFENLDLAALMNDTTRSSLTGTFRLNGRGTDPATDLRLDDLSVTLRDSYYGSYDVNDATLNGTLADGRLDFDARADLEGGTFDVTGTARPFRDVPSFAVRQGRFEHVDIGELTANPNQQSDLTGTFTAQGQGFDPQTMTLDARLDLEASRLNEQVINAAGLDLALRGGELSYEGRLDLPSGTTTIAGSGSFFGETLNFAIREGSVQGLDLGALLGIEGLDTSLNGRLRLNVDGTDPQTMTLDAALALDRSRVNDNTIAGGTVDVHLADGRTRAEADLRFDEGVAHLEAAGRFFDERPSYDLAGRISGVNVGDFLPTDTLTTAIVVDSLIFAVKGTGLNPKTMNAEGYVEGEGVRYDSVLVRSVETSFDLSDGLLTVDTLNVRSNVATAHAGGRVALYDSLGTYASDFTFQADIRDPGPLRRFVNADVFRLGKDSYVEGHVVGRPGRLRFDGEVRLNSLVYNDIRVAGLEARGAGVLGPDRAVQVAEVRGEASYFSIPSLSVQNIDAQFAYTPDSLSFTTSLKVDQRRDARIAGTVDLRPDNQRVLIEDLSLRLDQYKWQLLLPASISYGDEYRVSNFLIYSDDQQIAVDGVIDLDGEQSLVVTIENFHTGAVADLLDFRGLGGTLDGSLVLTGPAAAPNMEGTLNFDVVSFDQAVGDLHTEVRYDSLRLNMDALLTHQDGSTLSLEGYVPMDLRLSEGAGQGTGGGLQVTREEAPGDVSLHLAADSFAIGWVEPFLDPETVDEVEGNLTAAVDIAGTLDSPELSGSAALTGGRLGLPELGVTYHDISADARLADNQVRLSRIELHSGSGRVVGEGTIDLTELTLGEFDVSGTANDFLAIDTRAYRIVADADVDLKGTTSAPVVTGDATLVSADIRLTEETTGTQFEQVELTEDDLQMLERYFGIRVSPKDTTTFDLYNALALDLDVSMERDVWLRSRGNPEMNIQFTGDLDLQKNRNEDVQVFGTIDVIRERSYVNEFGRRFNITTGILTFNGAATNPYLDLEAEYDVRSRLSQGTEITIYLSVEGRLEDQEQLDITLRSEPETDITNIISYIATGRPAGEAFLLGGAGGAGNTGQFLLGEGAGLALNQLTNIIEGAAGSELGLDVIEIRQEGFQGATVTAGKYLSPRLFAAVSWPITFSSAATQERSTVTSTGSRQFTIEYELFDWLLARVTSDGSTVRMNLLYEYAY